MFEFLKNKPDAFEKNQLFDIRCELNDGFVAIREQKKRIDELEKKLELEMEVTTIINKKTNEVLERNQYLRDQIVGLLDYIEQQKEEHKKPVAKAKKTAVKSDSKAAFIQSMVDADYSTDEASKAWDGESGDETLDMYAEIWQEAWNGALLSVKKNKGSRK